MSENEIQLAGGFDLNDLLNQAMKVDEVADDPVVEQGFVSPIPLFVNIPQGTSASYPSSVRLDGDTYVKGDDMIAIAERDPQSGEYTRYYTNNLRMALVDTQQTQRGNSAVGARTMWPHTKDGQRDLSTDGGPACRTLNGFAPLPRYIGEVLFHPGHGRDFKIGFEDDMVTPVSNAENVCSSCAFSRWARGAKVPQPCKPTTVYIIWIAPQSMIKVTPDGKTSRETFPSPESGGILARLTGQNTGIELALKGRTEKQMGRMADGSPIDGIATYYTPKTSEMVRTYLDASKGVNPAAHQYVVGVAKTKRASDFIPMNWGSAVEEEIANGVKYVVVESPSYEVYPEGNPLNVGQFTTAYALSMTAGKNNFTTQKTSIPVFETDKENPMTESEFFSYLSNKMKYMAADDEYEGQSIRDRMLGIKFTLTDVNAALNEHRISIASPASSPALPNNVEDAEYEELPEDDMG